MPHSNRRLLAKAKAVLVGKDSSLRIALAQVINSLHSDYEKTKKPLEVALHLVHADHRGVQTNQTKARSSKKSNRAD